ncbi:MAG: DUF4838 domain-containing protein [Lachnospiraceae bacterium]|nr:DUF4838 domain-containing protein [Lachnospiraceae bacterium]
MRNIMRRHWRRFPAFALCLVLLIGILSEMGAGRADASQNGAKAAGCSLTVSEGRLGMNLFFTGITDTQAKNGRVTVDGVSHSLSAKQADGTYKVTHFVDAKDVVKKLSITLYSGNTKIALTNSGAVNGVLNYSVKDYLTEIENRDDEMGRLAKAIDVYGCCAYNYFVSDTIGVTVADADFSAYRMNMTGQLPAYITYYGSSLVLNDTITIRHYYKFTGFPGSSLIQVDGVTIDADQVKQYEIGADYALYYIEIPDVLAWDIDHTYELSVSIDGKQSTLSYSVLSYACDALAVNPQDRLGKLVKSIYWYNLAFQECLESMQTVPVTDYSDYMNSKYTVDMPVAVIVTPANATAEEEYAAKLLQKYIKEEDGYTPQIVTDAKKAGTYPFEISVGNTNRSFAKATYSSNDSYCIRSYNGGIAITGVGQLGLMHGAMRFLEAFGGYYYLSWNDLYRTNQNHFKYETSGIRIDYERPFLFTDMDICFSSIDPRHDLTDPLNGNYNRPSDQYPRTGRLFSLAFGLNGFYADTYCLPKTEAGRETWYLTACTTSQYSSPRTVKGLAAGQAHTLLAEFFPAETYFASHPEWYAASSWDEQKHQVPDAQRTRNSSQMCPYALVNDPEAYAIVLQHCYDMIANSYDPNAPIQIISISKNDGSDLCLCSKCINDRIAHGNSGGLYESVEYVQLLNKISQDLHKNGAYPNLYIDMLAYEWTVEAPPKDIVCDDHVIIRYAPIRRCYAHNLNTANHVTNAKYYQELVNWTKICKHVWIWDYNSNFMTTAGVYANVSVMQNDLKLYYELGVEGVYLQSNSRHLESDSEFGDIRNYIEGRLLQDPTRDYEEELAFITDTLYGNAGIYVREYMKHIEQQARNHHQIVNHRDDTCLYNTRLLTTFAGVHYWDEQKVVNGRMPDSEIGICEGLWKEINRIAEEEPDEVRTRIKKLELSWRLIKSTLNVYEFNNVSTYSQENAKLIRDMKNLDITYFSAIHGKLTSDCVYTGNHPDNWFRESDSMIGKFSSTNPGGNLEPDIPDRLFYYYTPE